MTALWGVTLGAGILLLLSPWMWPEAARRERPASARWLRGLLGEAGYAHVPPGRIILLSALLGGVGALAALVITRVPAIAAVAALALALAPLVWLRSAALRRRRSRRALWSDVCELLIASARSGMSLPDAVASLEHSAPRALQPAFRAFAVDLAASGHFDSSALRLKETLADPVADRIIETLRMTRQVGGTELIPVLRSLSSAVRTDALLRAEVESRQSWVRTAAVLGVVAPWIVLGLLTLRPEGVAAYASPAGAVVILTGAGVSVLAYAIMIRLGRLAEPRRLFS